MQPYSGKRFHGPCCRYGCCYYGSKNQPHYRKPNAREKIASRRRARAQANADLRRRAQEDAA